MKIQGIYKIRNCINGKIYIGQSVDVKKRFSRHKSNSLLRNINHPLYDSIRCYGIENFEFIIIEEIEDINKLDKREQYWMDFYQSYNRDYGYNLVLQAKGVNHSEETKQKIAESCRGRIP